MGDPDWYKNRKSAQPAKSLEYPMITQDPLPDPAPKLEGILGDTPGWVHLGFPAVGVFRMVLEGSPTWTGFVLTKKGTAVTMSYKEAAEAIEAAESLASTIET